MFAILWDNIKAGRDFGPPLYAIPENKFMDKDTATTGQQQGNTNDAKTERPMDKNIVPPEDTNLNHMSHNQENSAPGDESIEDELKNHEASTERD